MRAKSAKSLRLLKRSWPAGRIAWVSCMTTMAIALSLGCVNDSLEPTETPRAPTVAAVPAATSDSTTDAKQHVMVVYNRCAVPDPAIDASYASRGITSRPLVTEIHAGLTSIDEDAANEVVPELAESWTVRDRGRTYEFTLRKGLRFSDGSELTAEDVKWSWERSLSLSQTWTNAAPVFESVRGASRVINGETNELAGLEVVDDATLIVRLDEPMPLFPMMISGPAAFVLKRENVESWPVKWTNNNLINGASPPIDYDYHEFGISDFTELNMVVGAGPFKLSEYSADDAFADCVITRNDHYWGPPSRLAAVVFDQDPGTSTGTAFQPVTWFRNTDVDVLPVVDQVQAEELQKSNQAKAVTIMPPPYAFFLAFNPAVSPMDDVHFRRSLVLAADLTGEFQGGAEREYAIVPPRLTGTIPREEGKTPGNERPRTELGKSKYADRTSDIEIVMYTDGGHSFESRLDSLFDRWSETLGVRADLRRVETFDEYQSMRDGARVPIRAFAIKPIYPDAYAVLRLFDGAFGSGGGPSSNDENLLNLLTKSKSEPDPRVRRDLYAELEEYILSEALAIPLFVDWRDTQVVLQPWVHGYNPKRFAGSTFHDVWFDDTAPERSLP